MSSTIGRVEEHEAEHHRDEIEQAEAPHHFASRRRAWVFWKSTIGTTRMMRSTMATALATGQSRFWKNSLHKRAPDHQRLRAAEQVGDDEFADRRDEDEQRAGEDAGQRQRKRDLPERPERRRAEIGRRLEQTAVEPLERGVERQHHERQVGIDDADIDGEVGVQDDERVVDEAEPRQQPD